VTTNETTREIRSGGNNGRRRIVKHRVERQEVKLPEPGHEWLVVSDNDELIHFYRTRKEGSRRSGSVESCVAYRKMSDAETT
jgi:hypothetical protein